MELSPSFESSARCLPSPDGRFVATLFPNRVNIRSVQTLRAHDQKLSPATPLGQVVAFCWSPSSTRILVATVDIIHVLSCRRGSVFRAEIRNPILAPTTKSLCIRFGASDDEVWSFSPLGIKLSVFNLASSKAVEIANPKLCRPGSAELGYSVRPESNHVAILTRTAGKDVISIHGPDTLEVLRSWYPETVDAQGLAWVADGRWLVVWESAAHGRKLLFYTADGHLFRTWDGPKESTGEWKHAELGPGIKQCQLTSNRAKAALCDYTRSVYVIDALSATEVMRLTHPSVIAPTDTLQVWQEQLQSGPSGATEHTFVRASQTISAPGKSPSAGGTTQTEVAVVPGTAAIAFDSSAGLLASRMEDAPTTLWVWDLASSELRAVLLFHSNIVSFDWHPHVPEILLISCHGDVYGHVLFVWDPLSNGPVPVQASQLAQGNNTAPKLQASWLSLEHGSPTLLVTHTDHYAFASLTGEDVPIPPWKDASGSSDADGYGPSRSPVESSGPAYSADPFEEDYEAIDGEPSDIEDTFIHKSMVNK